MRLPAGAVSATGHSVAAGRDVNVRDGDVAASGGGFCSRGGARERDAAVDGGRSALGLDPASCVGRNAQF
jgi:hypothetical protein